MTLFDPDSTQRLLQMIKKTMSMFLLIVLFYILQKISEMHFVCLCNPSSYLNTVLYMMAPPLIFTFVVNIIEPFHLKRILSTRSYWCCKCCCSFNNCCGHVLKLFTRYIGLAAVWMSIVLLDGDWYFCLRTNHNKSQTGLPCRNNLTYSETLIKDAYKTESLDIGFVVICVFLFLWSLFEIRRAYCRMKCCTNSCTNWCTKWGINQCANWCANQYTKCSTWCTNNCPSDCECSPYYVVVYEELLAEQVSNHLNKELEKIAKQKAKEICKPYLNDIKKNELLSFSHTMQQDDGKSEVSDPWEKISDFNFYLTDLQQTAGSSEAGNETTDSSEAGKETTDISGAEEETTGPSGAEKETPGLSEAEEETPGPSEAEKETPGLSEAEKETTDSSGAEKETPGPSEAEKETTDSSGGGKETPSPERSGEQTADPCRTGDHTTSTSGLGHHSTGTPGPEDQTPSLGESSVFSRQLTSQTSGGDSVGGEGGDIEIHNDN